MKTRWLNIPPRSLKYADKWLFWRAVMLAITLRLSLKLIPFKTTIKLLKMFEKNDENKATTRIAENDLKMCRFMIRLAYKLWPVINCLSISLAFWLVMKRKGINTDLRFGILKEDHKLRSHAWLEYDNNVLSPDDGAIRKYKTFAKAIL